MAALTDIDVGNLALDILTEGSVTTFDGNTKAQRLLKRNIDVSREAMLKAHAWTFALFRGELTGEDLGDVEPNERRYFYARPDDALRILPFRSGGWPLGVDILYEETAEGIYSPDSGPLKALWVGNIVDPAEMPAEFVRVWAADIARWIAHPLTQKANMIEAARAAKEEALKDARKSNAIQRGFVMPPENFHTIRGDHSGGLRPFSVR